jgi:hypothetical protein
VEIFRSAGLTRKTIGVRRWVSERVEDGCRPPTLWAGYPRNGSKAILELARPQGIEGSGMAGPDETLGSPWPPLAIHLCARPSKGSLGGSFSNEHNAMCKFDWIGESQV